MQLGRWVLISLMACLMTGAAECQQAPRSAAPATAATSASSIVTAEISGSELRDTLAAMAKSHSEKTQLAFYAALPWKGVGHPYSDFYATMGKQQGELGKELASWAKAHNVDLTYHYSNDTAGQAQKIIEARQEKLVRGDGNADFLRDTLMQMYTDYEWQISLIQALLPRVKDESLRRYLGKSLKVHEDGSAQLLTLLKRFKG